MFVEVYFSLCSLAGFGVTLQVIFSIKSFLALWACMVLLPRVHQFMAFIVLKFVENFETLGTLVDFFFCVLILMLFAVGLASKLFHTVTTL